MSDLAKLIKDHAFWSDEVRRLKKEGETASTFCLKYRPKIGVIDQDKPYDCIQESWAEYQYQGKSQYGDWMNYNEIFDNSEPCEHCVNVRKLKAERMQARRRLGSIRGAITRVGRSL